LRRSGAASIYLSILNPPPSVATMPPIVRSILAIVAGFLFTGVLAIGTDAVLMSAGVLPPATERVTSTGVLLLTVAYVAVYAIAGCWVTARLAPSHPMRHALIMGGIALAMQLALLPMSWQRTPAWYNLLGLALVMPYAWAGGRLRERQLAQGADTPAMA